jgi:futalosine hydrolase
MKILLVAATAFEIRPLTDKLPLISHAGDHLTGYQYRKTSIDVLIPGVGMMPTAFHLGKQLAGGRYDLALNAGIAGAYDHSLKVGSVVNVTADCICETGAEDGDQFHDLIDLGLMDPDEHPYQGGRLINSPVPQFRALLGIPEVEGSTVNTMHGNHRDVKRLSRNFRARVESMEGAAFLYACLFEKVPCLQIRSISNYVEDRDKSRWDVKLALKTLNHTLNELIRETSV